MQTTRYFIYISFKGSDYHGWQMQPNAVTVQGVVENALSTILGKKTAITGAGRTDSGVHARIFCAHFNSESPHLSENMSLIYRLNSYLPKDISVLRLSRVYPDAHARFSALSRTYKYYITRTKDPFSEDFSWFLQNDADLDLMNRACVVLMKYTDFTSFSRLHTDVKTNECIISQAFWEQHSGKLIFTIKANRFLRNMVRAIVGTMIQVGKGKTDIMEFERIILAKERSKAGMSAPAQGLFLEEIEYPSEIFIDNDLPEDATEEIIIE